MLVQIVQNYHCELVGVGFGQAERVERRGYLVAEDCVVCFVLQNFLCAYAVVVFHTRFQAVYAYLVFNVEARFLP